MPKKTPQKPDWKNRIVGHGEKPAREFTFNGLNWREHPDEQRKALDEILNLVGWVTGVVENVRTGNLIDGHARIEQALARDPETLVPFTQVDLSEEEEKQILAIFDPIGDMATANEERLRELIDAAGFDSEILLSVLAGIQEVEVPIPDEEPNLSDPAFNYESQFGVIVTCESEAHQKEVFEKLEAEGYAVRVVVV